MLTTVRMSDPGPGIGPGSKDATGKQESGCLPVSISFPAVAQSTLSNDFKSTDERLTVGRQQVQNQHVFHFNVFDLSHDPEHRTARI